MEILLVAGSISNKLYSNIAYKKNIINKQPIYISELIELLKKGSVRFNTVLIVDEGIDETLENLQKILTETKKIDKEKEVVMMTSNLEYKHKFDGTKVFYNQDIRLFEDEYNQILKSIVEDEAPSSTKEEVAKGNKLLQQVEEEPKREKGSFIGRFSGVFRAKKEVEEESDDKRFKHIRKGISRVIGVTGHRGVGITSTVVNLGYEASKRNLSTIIIDLDVYNRTTNLYFSEFMRQAERDEHLAGSLLKCLAKPQDYQSNACQVASKLWIAGLTYNFEDKRLMNQFFNTNKLMNLLTVLRQHFNVILLDLPFEVLKDFEEVIPNMDAFALCANNNQYSIITTLRNMGNCLSSENIGYVNAKSKLVITRYNDRAQYENEFFTPDKVSEIFASDLCEELSIKMPIAGFIRQEEEFDMQIERDIPIVETNKAFKEYYSNVLLRIMEGAN